MDHLPNAVAKRLLVSSCKFLIFLNFFFDRLLILRFSPSKKNAKGSSVIELTDSESPKGGTKATADDPDIDYEDSAVDELEDDTPVKKAPALRTRARSTASPVKGAAATAATPSKSKKVTVTGLDDYSLSGPHRAYPDAAALDIKGAGRLPGFSLLASHVISSYGSQFATPLRSFNGRDPSASFLPFDDPSNAPVELYPTSDSTDSWIRTRKPLDKFLDADPLISATLDDDSPSLEALGFYHDFINPTLGSLDDLAARGAPVPLIPEFRTEVLDRLALLRVSLYPYP